MKTIPVCQCHIELSPVPKAASWRLNMHGERNLTDASCESKRKVRAFFRSMVLWVNSSQSTIGAMRPNHEAAASNMKSNMLVGVSRAPNGQSSLGTSPG